MIILIALLIIALIIYFLYRKKHTHHNTANSTDNSYSKGHSVLTAILIVLSVVQAPFFYYYTFGLASLFIVVPYLLVSLFLTLILILQLNKRKKISQFQKVGVVISIFLGITSLFWGSIIIEKIDWHYRLSDRKAIVNKILKGEYKERVLETSFFPPISNGGNEIFIDKNSQGEITVTFYIDRGFLDHYSAFIFTTNKDEIQRFDSMIKSNRNKTNKKMADNWYKIAE